MLEFISIVTSIAGLFTLLDLFIEKNAKAKISEYVFGFGTADLSGFEHNVIQALLSRLRVDGRISFKKVLFRYSMVIAALVAVAAFFGEYMMPYFSPEYESEGFAENLLSTLKYFPLLVLFFWPFDCWSLWVTQKIFGNGKSNNVGIFFGKIILDVFITILPLFVLFVIVMMPPVLMDVEDGDRGFLFVLFGFMFILLNGVGSLLITFVQLLTLAIGMLLRFFLRLTRLNQGLAMVSRAHEFPFTFIGVITGLIAACVVTFV